MDTSALTNQWYFLTTASYRDIVRIIDDANFMYEFPVLSSHGKKLDFNLCFTCYL